MISILPHERQVVKTEAMRKVEARELELKSAMAFFLWEVLPIGGQVTLESPLCKNVRRLSGFVPLSPVDIVSENIEREARGAYNVLLREEMGGSAEVEKFWGHPRWKTLQVQSFGKRLEQIGDGKIQFVIWVDEAQYRGPDTIERIESEIPGFLD